MAWGTRDPYQQAMRSAIRDRGYGGTRGMRPRYPTGTDTDMPIIIHSPQVQRFDINEVLGRLRDRPTMPYGALRGGNADPEQWNPGGDSFLPPATAAATYPATRIQVLGGFIVRDPFTGAYSFEAKPGYAGRTGGGFLGGGGGFGGGPTSGSSPSGTWGAGAFGPRAGGFAPMQSIDPALLDLLRQYLSQGVGNG